MDADDAALLPIYQEIISLILSEPGKDVQAQKLAVCRKYSLDVMPKNSAILKAAPPEVYETVRERLLVKPTRTLSGVAPVAVMTSPHPCPHGKCLPCPGDICFWSFFGGLCGVRRLLRWFSFFGFSFCTILFLFISFGFWLLRRFCISIYLGMFTFLIDLTRTARRANKDKC